MIFFKLSLFISLFFSCTSYGQVEVMAEQQRIPYGQIADTIQQNLDANAGKFYRSIAQKIKKQCKKDGQAYKVEGVRFGCQLNVNKALDGKRQTVFSGLIPKDTYLGKFDGFKSELDNNVRIKVDIRPIFSDYRNRLIDSPEAVVVKERRSIEKNVFLKHLPLGKDLFTTACIDLPGVEIIPSVTRPVIYLKKKYFIKSAKIRVRSEVDLGTFRINSARACAVYRFSLDDSDLRDGDFEKFFSSEFLSSKFSASDVHLLPLTVSKIKNEGIKVRKSEVIYKNSLAKFFSIFTNVNKRAQSAVNSEMQRFVQSRINTLLKVSNREIQNGNLWRKLANLGGLQIPTRFAQSLQDIIKQDTRKMAESGIRFGKVEVVEQCRRLVNETIASFPALGLASRCSEIIESVEFIPFFFKEDLRRKGCYSRSYMTDRGYQLTQGTKNPAWRSDCYLSGMVKVGIAEQYQATAACIQRSIDNQWTPSETTQNCQNILLSEAFGLDPSITDQLFGMSLLELNSFLSNEERLQLAGIFGVTLANVPALMAAENLEEASGVLSDDQMAEVEESQLMTAGQIIQGAIGPHSGAQDRANNLNRMGCTSGAGQCMVERLPRLNARMSLKVPPTPNGRSVANKPSGKKNKDAKPKKPICLALTRVDIENGKVEGACQNTKKTKKNKKQVKKSPKKNKKAKRQEKKAPAKKKKAKKQVKKAPTKKKKAKKQAKKAPTKKKKAKKQVKKAPKKKKKTKKQAKKAKKQARKPAGKPKKKKGKKRK